MSADWEVADLPSLIECRDRHRATLVRDPGNRGTAKAIRNMTAVIDDLTAVTSGACGVKGCTDCLPLFFRGRIVPGTEGSV